MKKLVAERELEIEVDVVEGVGCPTMLPSRNL
jgi:hypothetical protein